MLIEVVEAKASTAGGLLLTEGSKEKPTMGKVGGRGRREAGGEVGTGLAGVAGAGASAGLPL